MSSIIQQISKLLHTVCIVLILSFHLASVWSLLFHYMWCYLLHCQYLNTIKAKFWNAIFLQQYHSTWSVSGCNIIIVIFKKRIFWNITENYIIWQYYNLVTLVLIACVWPVHTGIHLSCKHLLGVGLPSVDPSLCYRPETSCRITWLLLTVHVVWMKYWDCECMSVFVSALCWPGDPSRLSLTEQPSEVNGWQRHL